MSSEVAITTNHASDVRGLSAQDLTELGSVLTTAGYTPEETRALISEIQEAAARVAVLQVPRILDKILKIQAAKTMDMIYRIRLLPNHLGYVSRDAVLAIIQAVAAAEPRYRA